MEQIIFTTPSSILLKVFRREVLNTDHRFSRHDTHPHDPIIQSYQQVSITETTAQSSRSICHQKRLQFIDPNFEPITIIRYTVSTSETIPSASKSTTLSPWDHRRIMPQAKKISQSLPDRYIFGLVHGIILLNHA